MTIEKKSAKKFKSKVHSCVCSLQILSAKGNKGGQ